MEPYSRVLLHSAISSVLGLVAGCVLVGAVVGPVLLAFFANDAATTEMMLHSIPRQIAWPLAMEIMLTGERISAAEAHRICLINKVVPRDQVMKEARRYAGIIAENGPLAVQAVKRSALAGMGLPTDQALEKEMEIGIPVSMSEDAREGPKAFKEKRKPEFKGK